MPTETLLRFVIIKWEFIKVRNFKLIISGYFIIYLMRKLYGLGTKPFSIKNLVKEPIILLKTGVS